MMCVKSDLFVCTGLAPPKVVSLISLLIHVSSMRTCAVCKEDCVVAKKLGGYDKTGIYDKKLRWFDRSNRERKR